MIDRDLIVVVGKCDVTYVTVNGEIAGSGMEYGYDVIDMLPSLFYLLKHTYNAPVIYELYEDDYFTHDEVEAFWGRDSIFDSDIMFTEDELEILNETGDMDKFTEQIRKNLNI